MNSNCHPFYAHSGKFGFHGPVLALAAGAAAAWPLGLAYAYLIKWIPFIYLNFLITAGYGFAFGMLASWFLKIGKVRNGPIALLCGIGVGGLAWYGSWNGCVHALIQSGPWFLTPRQILKVMGLLYDQGTWGIGLSSQTPVAGVLLAIVWLVEGAVIVSLSTIIGYGSIANTPFCELHGCWLDEEKKMDKLDAFTHPDHITAFKAGDIAPLDLAQPRVPASGGFARLTLKHSSRCDDYCALSIANVTLTLDKDGKPQEQEERLITNLWVPKTMFSYLSQFDHPTAKATVGGRGL
jgi:hypothetical protein